MLEAAGRPAVLPGAALFNAAAHRPLAAPAMDPLEALGAAGERDRQEEWSSAGVVQQALPLGAGVLLGVRWPGDGSDDPRPSPDGPGGGSLLQGFRRGSISPLPPSRES